MLTTVSVFQFGGVTLIYVMLGQWNIPQMVSLPVVIWWEPIAEEHLDLLGKWLPYIVKLKGQSVIPDQFPW